MKKTVRVVLLLMLLLVVIAIPTSGVMAAIRQQTTLIPAFVMTADQLGAIAGIVLSVVCAYVPGIGTWFNKQTSDIQRSLMAVMLLLVSGGVLALGCFGQIAAFECSTSTGWKFLFIFVDALIANQGTNLLLPRIGTKAIVSANDDVLRYG
jgi:hypothetical protein